MRKGIMSTEPDKLSSGCAPVEIARCDTAFLPMSAAGEICSPTRHFGVLIEERHCLGNLVESPGKELFPAGGERNERKHAQG